MLLRRLRLAARAEDGAVTIPTVIWLPIFFLILFFGLEMMFISFRQVLLDHAVDVTTRELRLGTATLDTHDELKAAVCTAMHFVPDCEANMAVEVFPVDTDTWSLTNTNGILCTDFDLDRGSQPRNQPRRLEPDGRDARLPEDAPADHHRPAVAGDDDRRLGTVRADIGHRVRQRAAGNELRGDRT